MEYIFRVRFRAEPVDSDVTLSPATFETVLSKRAPPSGEDGWLFFREDLWRGEANDERYLRELAEEGLIVEVRPSSSASSGRPPSTWTRYARQSPPTSNRSGPTRSTRR